MNKKMKQTITVMSVAAMAGTGLVAGISPAPVQAVTKASVKDSKTQLIEDIQRRLEAASRVQSSELVRHVGKDIPKVTNLLAQNRLNITYERVLSQAIFHEVHQASQLLRTTPELITSDAIKRLELKASQADATTKKALAPDLQKLKQAKATHYFKLETQRVESRKNMYTFSKEELTKNIKDAGDEFISYKEGQHVAKKMHQRQLESIYYNNILLLGVTKDVQLQKETDALIKGHPDATFRTKATNEIKKAVSGAKVVNVEKAISLKLQSGAFDQVFVQTLTPRGKALIQTGFKEMERVKKGSSIERKKHYEGGLIQFDLRYYGHQNQFKSEDELLRVKGFDQQAQKIFGKNYENRYWAGVNGTNKINKMETEFYLSWTQKKTHVTLEELDRAIAYAKKSNHGALSGAIQKREFFLLVEARSAIDFYLNSGKNPADKALVDKKISMVTDAKFQEELQRRMKY